MLLKSLLEQKSEFNQNFELNNIDTRFSQMQLATLSSCILGIPFKETKLKNDIYILFKKYKFKKALTLGSMNLEVAYTKIMQGDRELISKAMSSLEGTYEEIEIQDRPRLKGVVAILEYDYR